MSHLILEMSDVASWGAPRHGSGLVIPVGHRPTILQPDRRIAEAEALRLARTGQPQHPLMLPRGCVLQSFEG